MTTLLPFPFTLAPGVEVVADPRGTGIFLRFAVAEPTARVVLPVGGGEVARFMACHRYEPFWMTAKAGAADLGAVAAETQSLLAELPDGRVALFIPLIDGTARCVLRGGGEGKGLELAAETDDPDVPVPASIVGLYVAAGDDPYTLLAEGAKSVAAHLGTVRLREDKPTPTFADGFGWCTWDAFYQEVSHDKVREGLESFAAGGIRPRFLILDDGWQSVRQTGESEKRLTAFAANEKFPGDLAPTVAMAKGEFGVETFLVWHAFHGYWSGVDAEALPEYAPQEREKTGSPDLGEYVANVRKWFGARAGVVPPEHAYRFFQDYHRHLREQGVDGVKVDNQGSMEMVSYGFGRGRVGMMRAYHEALEGSVAVHFAGKLINCMSCANEMFYSALASTLTRTSTDFWPKKPETHGLHLYVNAQVGAWFGHFVHPDWDMFQSGHPAGAFHAAGRAVSGSPVYVSDKPGAHDFALLAKLVLPDGSVPRADGPGVPTRDCLFHDPTQEDVLLKIANTSGGAGLVGVFHARYRGEEDTTTLSCPVSPSDVPALTAGERFAAYAHHSGELKAVERTGRLAVTLPPLAAEVFTFVPIEDGIAPVGLTRLFNAAGAVRAKGWEPGVAAYGVELHPASAGELLFWCEWAPSSVTVGDTPAAFSYDAVASRLSVALPEPANTVSGVPLRVRVVR
jgi:raffinose synthase